MTEQGKREEKSKKLKVSKEKQYFVLKDETFIWTSLALLVSFFIIISFLQVRGLTTIHSYTINVIFGMFSILFYVWILLLILQRLFSLKKVYSLHFFHFSLWRLALFFVAIAIFGSLIFNVYYGYKGFASAQVFPKIFDGWFTQFKRGSNPWLPYKWTAGIFGTFIYALTSIFGGTFGMVFAYIFAIVFFALACSTFFISDMKFQLISLNKKHREVAKAKMLAKKTTNIKVKIKVAENSKNNENDNNFAISMPHELHSNESSKLASFLQENASDLKDSSTNLEQDQLITNQVVQENSTNSDSGIQITNEKFHSEELVLNNSNNAITNNLDDDPFDYTEETDILAISSNSQQKLIKQIQFEQAKESDENLQKTVESYISKFIDPTELNKYQSEIDNVANLEEQAKELEKTKTFEITIDFEEKKSNDIAKKNVGENEENNKKTKRYSLIEDEESFF
ncbi:ABC-type uncharacterized transport system, permease component [Metamycoplasma arthritidis]|uniref:Uncharacterized protein n=1 Tax=Metamycoplasma arthritidis (strain 158L3-1) TaxID=243272 RepID=B3PN40_META1|nr:hypothetical protein [Metamycoplasma arthritidis]ACF07442.1 conserved hypothetical protein [Metamycoplasma arthritidis 158L3-1]VEU78963.1 ABC-type uncharacterized transport system, permease component [Metamycoplasma arthritidis]